jgi:hypothetical protein
MEERVRQLEEEKAARLAAAAAERSGAPQRLDASTMGANPGSHESTL